MTQRHLSQPLLEYIKTSYRISVKFQSIKSYLLTHSLIDHTNLYHFLSVTSTLRFAAETLYGSVQVNVKTPCDANIGQQLAPGNLTLTTEPSYQLITNGILLVNWWGKIRALTILFISFSEFHRSIRGSPTRLQKQEDHHYLRVRVQLLQCIRQAATKWHSNSTDSVLLQNSQIASDLTSQSPKLLKRPENGSAFIIPLPLRSPFQRMYQKGPLASPQGTTLCGESFLPHCCMRSSSDRPNMVIALGEGATQYDQRPGAWGSQETMFMQLLALESKIAV